MDKGGESLQRQPTKKAKNEKGECPRCGKSPRILTRTEDGQKMCLRCRRDRQAALSPIPNMYAGFGQLDYARRLGFQVPENIENEDLFRILDGFETVTFYILDVWEMLTGSRPKTVGIKMVDMEELVFHLHTRHATATHAIIETQHYRRDVAFGRLEEESILHTDDSHYELDYSRIPALKPPIPRDHYFRIVAKLLHSFFPQHVPQQTLLSRLFRKIAR